MRARERERVCVGRERREEEGVKFERERARKEQLDEDGIYYTPGNLTGR